MTYSSPDFLQTGQSEAHGSLLVKVIAFLKQRKHKLIRKMNDRVSLYAAVMKDSWKTRYVIIAKGSRLYRDIVSCQSSLPALARDINTPIVLAWKEPQKTELQFIIFNPCDIIEENYGLNMRKNVQMINFSINLGAPVDPDLNIAKAYSKVKPRQMKLL